MAGNHQDGLGLGVGDEFFEQILAVPPPYGGGGDTTSMALQLGLGGESGGAYRGMGMGLFPLGLNLEDGFLRHGDGDGVAANGNSDNDNSSCSAANTAAVSGIGARDAAMQMKGLFPSFQIQPVRLSPPPPSQPQIHQYHCQPASAAVTSASQPPVIRPRVRARRGQATDPHSIAERLRRERIAERMRALQGLVPSCNKADKAAMLDEIVDYVKFLRLQVKVLSMSRVGAAGAVAQLVSDVPLSSIEGDEIKGGRSEAAFEKWSSDGTEEQVAKLMEEDVGGAMQFLQSKALCIMPISLASAIFGTNDGEV